MKYTRVILLAVLFAMSCMNGWAQKSPGRAKIYRDVKRLSRTSDPASAVKEIEAILPTITSTKTGITRMRFLLSFRLADLYVRTGEYAKAEGLLSSLVAEVKKNKPRPIKATLGPDGTMYDCFERLGYFYLKTGNLRKAEAVFSESASVRNSVYPPRSVHRVHPIVGYGSLYFAQGEMEKTYASFNKAEQQLNRATSTSYDYDNVTRLYLSDLAEICLLQGRHREGWDYINKLSIASSGIGKFGSRIGRNLETSRILELKARYYLLRGDYSHAEEYLDRALHFYSPKITSSDVRFKLLKTQALLYWYRGDRQKSNEAFLNLIRSYRDHIAQNFIAMSEYEKEQFYNTLKSDFNLFNAYALDNHSSSGARILFEEMYNNALNTKALLLNETNKIKNNIMQSNDQTLIARLRQWEESKSKLSTVYFDKNAAGKVDSLEKAIEVLEKQINGQSNLFVEKENSRHWGQVRSALRPGEAVVEMVRINAVDKKVKNNYGPNSGLSDSIVYLAMVVRPDMDTLQCIILPEGKLLETRFLSYYRNSITARSADNLTYDKFWTPLKLQLKDVSKVYFSPDGVFNQINLNTLRNPSTGKFLLDEIEVSYLTNSGDLLKADEKPDEIPVGVLFGRPEFDREKINSTSQPGSESFYGTRNVLTDVLSNFKDQEFSDLPGTEAEINTIEQTLRGRQVKVRTYKGPDALEENVKAINNPSILHIATHGFFVEDDASHVNPMIRSGLVLAGIKNHETTSGEDGILTAYEATNLKLDKTSLVVLSACETGLGEVRNGEGVYGLQRAIIVAGANNLLMSLWKVDDEATAMLMSEFYKNWMTFGNQTAFRKAQMFLREKYPDPYYWGAFIMLGK